jgi:hypothetical protein
MQVSSISLDFDTRFWLYAGTITLRDETGAVVGSVSGLSASNFSELTVGSDYRISVPTNFVVKATQSKYITVNASFLGYTDRANGTINITQAQVRAVDGTGITDTESVNGSANVRSFTFQGSNIGQLIITTDSSSPAAGTIQVSTAAQTQNVVLGIFDIKSQNQSGTLQNLTVGLNLSTSSIPVGTIFSSVSIKAAGLTYSASSLSTSSATFTNLQIPLTADTYIPVTVYATLAADTNTAYDNVTVYVTLTPSTNTVGVIDSTYNTVSPASSAPLTANTQTFTASGLSFSGLMAVTSVTANRIANSSSTASFNMAYTLTAGNNPIYISKTYTSAVTATTTTTGNVVFTLASFTDSDSTNDGTTYFYIAPGQSKTFTAVVSAAGTSGNGTYKISNLNYGSDTSGTGGTLSASTIGGYLYTVVTGF